MLQYSTVLSAHRARAAGAGLIAAAALAASLAFATPSAAAEVFIYSATPTAFELGSDASQDPMASYFGMAPQLIHAKEGPQFGGGQDFTVLAFCIDFFTPTPTSSDYDSMLDPINTINYAYHDGTLSEANLGADPDAEFKIITLINFGTSLWAHTAHNDVLQTKLAAIQGAIWQVQTGLTIVFHPWFVPDPGANQLIQDYASLTGLPGNLPQNEIRALFSNDGGSQGLAYALRTGVPEPATWGLMIVGFFGAGSLLRRSRRRVSAAG